MKLSRQKELLRFFQWLAGFPAHEFPDNLLGLMLLYALHSDSNLDAKGIYLTLSTNPELEKTAMSVAEKLKAEGRLEGISQGISQGLWVGRIQSLQEFLQISIDSCETLEVLTLKELQIKHAALHREYQVRFKHG